MEEYRRLNASENYEVRLPVWSELEATNLRPPAKLDRPAGDPRGGPKKRARSPGRGDVDELPRPGRSRTETHPPESPGTAAGTAAVYGPRNLESEGVRSEESR